MYILLKITFYYYFHHVIFVYYQMMSLTHNTQVFQLCGSFVQLAATAAHQVQLCRLLDLVGFSLITSRHRFTLHIKQPTYALFKNRLQMLWSNWIIFNSPKPWRVLIPSFQILLSFFLSFFLSSFYLLVLLSTFLLDQTFPKSFQLGSA